MHKYAIGVIGASGYSGIELCRILTAHAGVEVRFVASDRWEGAIAANLAADAAYR